MTDLGPAAGEVVSYDDHYGAGTVRADDGTELYFHCTQIADGSRTISVGARVTFSVRAGLPGRWEAAAVTQQA